MDFSSKWGNIAIIGGAIVLAVAIVIRISDIGPLLANPVTGLWKVSIALLLLAIAIGVNKS
ncbi:hypothetical protein IID04_01505 [PVC group bacterium]|nr:hypothetical protein [PVC group bacterium]